MIKRIAVIFGAILVLVGILGFVPGVTTFSPDVEHGRLFGLFAVDTVHNMVHLVSGVAAMLAGYTSEASRMFFKVFGVIYALLAVLGFGYGNEPLFGVMASNLLDAALHTIIAAVALFLGFGHLPARYEHPGDMGTHHPA